MENSYTFFISHSSADNNIAKELYDILLEINPEWKEKIFLDCKDENPSLQTSEEWKPAIMNAVNNSRYLIFITSSLEYLKEGNGWVFKEVSMFDDRKADRKKHWERSELNVSYFGIFLCDCDFENDLFNDPNHGNEYRMLFQRPEHLILGNGETVLSARERIKQKIDFLVSRDNSDENASLILDKVLAFADKKSKNDDMFKKESIDDQLIPTIQNGDRKLNFDAFFNTVRESHVALLGTEGGCGKTTLLTKLFFNYLDIADVSNPESMIPIYVDAKSLGGENHIILRYLSKNIFNQNDAITNRSTGANVSLLDFEFSQKRKSPRYLLIIDGYNEVPESVIKKFDNELAEFLPTGRYPNVRVVLSGRHVGNRLPESLFEQVFISKLSNDAVVSYLKSKAIDIKKIRKSLFNILAIPMYLKIYAEISSEELVKTRADLLLAFLNWQEKKDMESASNEKTTALYRIILRHVFPIISHKIIFENINNDNPLVLTQDELESFMLTVPEILTSTPYKKFYGSDYRELLRKAEFGEMDELDLSDLSIGYLVGVCKMLHMDKESKTMDFVHQIYRDFFCAMYIAEHIKRNAGSDEAFIPFPKKLLNRDVIEFVAELLREKAPFFDESTELWNYSCNEKSHLIPLLDVIRESSDTSPAVVADIVNMLKYARANDLSGLNFSKLDLTKTAIQGCHFCNFDKSGSYPASFEAAKINRENIFVENHFDVILAGCTNESYAACVDSTGIIKFWDKNQTLNSPVKIITEVRYPILKMRFSNDGNSLLAMTAHEIIRIPISSEFSSKATPDIIFKTAKRLRDFIIDDNGEISFTTNLNSYNYKSIKSPDEPDKYTFYGINSAAAVNAAGNRIVFGHIAGYDGLKIYDYDSEQDNWKESKFGYSAILNDFFGELESLFKATKLYYHFPSDNPVGRRTYFPYVQQQFEDCTHNHYRVLSLIANRCRDTLKYEKFIKMTPEQDEKLNALVKKYENIMRNKLLEENLLMHLSGRKITGLSFKKDTNTVLVSCTIDYMEKLKYQQNTTKLYKNRRYDSIVLELDTDTMNTRLITRVCGDYFLEADYCGDDILIRSKYQFAVYDPKGNDILHVSAVPKTIQNFIIPRNKNTFFAVAKHFIYEFDKDMRCVKSMNNYFNTLNVVYGINREGEEFLFPKILLNENADTEFNPIINLKTLRYCDIDVKDLTVTTACDIAELDDMSFKLCSSEKLVSFKNDIKQSECEIPYKLFVCGCDFRKVTGNITNPEYMQMLATMGAVTDFVEIEKPEITASTETFIPSAEDLIFPEGIDESVSQFSLRNDLSLEENCYFSDPVGGIHLYEQKVWALINRGSYSTNDLEETDYLILEWISSLKFSYSNMIDHLVEAGIIEKPTRFVHVGKRLSSTLHKTFKFLFRTEFCENGVLRNIPIYTVCFPFGAKLLEHITGVQPKNPLCSPKKKFAGYYHGVANSKNKSLSIRDNNKLREIRQTLSTNQWFTLTARRYKHLIRDYSLGSVFDTENHFRGRGNIHAYIQLGEQTFFAQSFRRITNETPFLPDIVEKVERMCIMSIYYKSLKRYEQQLNPITKQPIIVLIGEDFEHCKLLNSEVKNFYPNVRKLFTFDTLLVSNDAFENAGNYFEFDGDTAHSVKLDNLLL